MRMNSRAIFATAGAVLPCILISWLAANHASPEDITSHYWAFLMIGTALSGAVIGLGLEIIVSLFPLLSPRRRSKNQPHEADGQDQTS